MADVTVRALKAFSYRGRDYQAEDLVVMDPVEALAASRRGHVSLTRVIQTRDLTAESEPTAEPTRTKRRYKRRDLIAESE